MTKLRTRLVLGAIALGSAAAAAAGTAQVSFTHPESYSDAGNSTRDEPGNLRDLARHLERLAQQRLPAGQSLQVEVLDVDLAGTVQPSRDGSGLRTVRGMADFPKMHVRWALVSGGTTLASGDEWIRDLHYTSSTLVATMFNDPLRYEKRMLAHWFDERFATRAAAAR